MWLRQARYGLRGLRLLAVQQSCLTRWAVRVPRRHLSLADLAKAFDDLGTSAAGHTPSGDRATQSPSQQTSAQRPRWRSEMSSLTRVRSGPTRSPASNSNKSKSAHKRTSTHSEATTMMPFSLTYAEQLRSMSEPALCSEIDLQRGRLAHANMLLCLLEVYRRLWLSQQPQEQQQQEGKEGFTRDTRMRVLYVSAAEAAGGSSNSSNLMGTSSYGRSDRLLEAVLRVLAKISPIELEVYAERWLQSATTTPTPTLTQSPRLHCDTTTPSASVASEKARMTALYPFLSESTCCMRRPFAYAFGTVVQQWLLTRAAALPLGRCIEFIHLLVQQRLFYSDPLLLTLVDTVLVRRNEIDDMNALVLLFDSMLRCQNDMSVAMRVHQKYNNTTSTSNNTGRSNSVSSDAMSSLPRAWHPLLNTKVHNALAERFVFLLVHRTQQKLSNGGSDDDADDDQAKCSSLATLTTTSFLFLTLALAKLWHFHDEIIAALLPGMADYLRHHPEQYYGSIMMLGRPENTACEPDVLHVLVHNLTQLLTRRGQAYRRELHAQHTLRRQLSGPDAADAADDVALSDVTHDAYGEEKTEDGSVRRDAAVGQADVLAEGGQETEADAMQITTNDDKSVTTAASQTAPAFKVSLVDVHALSSFLTCLWHQYTLVLNTLQARGAFPFASATTSNGALTVQSMQREMYTLVCRLLDDVYSGVGSLEALRLGMSGAAIERLLRCLLRIGQQLASEQAQLHRVNEEGAQGTEDKPGRQQQQQQQQRCGDVYVLHHPLLVELTYVWTLHIRRHVVSHRTQPSSPTPPPPQQQSTAAAGDAPLVRVNETLSVTASTLQPAWQQHVKDLLQSLLHAGLLLREVQVLRPRPTQTSQNNKSSSNRVPQPVRIYYTMPDALLARTPRVQEAVMAVKKELARIARRQQQQRARRRQQQQQQQVQVQQPQAVQRRTDTGSHASAEGDDEAVVTNVFAVQAVRTPAVFGRFSAVMKLVSGEPV